MYKFLVVLLSLNLFTCEKPAPQKPKVISTITYMDTIAYDSIAATKIPQKDGIPTDSIPPSVQPKEIIPQINHDFVRYSNVAKQEVFVKYSQKDSLKFAYVRFSEKNLNSKLTARNLNSNIYRNDTVKWETKYNNRTGLLTIHGTWYDFIIQEKPKYEEIN